jgi:hypothetical protein
MMIDQADLHDNLHQFISYGNVSYNNSLFRILLSESSYMCDNYSDDHVKLLCIFCSHNLSFGRLYYNSYKLVMWTDITEWLLYLYLNSL